MALNLTNLRDELQKLLGGAGNAVKQAAVQSFNDNPTVRNVRTIQQAAPVIGNRFNNFVNQVNLANERRMGMTNEKIDIPASVQRVPTFNPPDIRPKQLVNAPVWGGLTNVVGDIGKSIINSPSTFAKGQIKTAGGVQQGNPQYVLGGLGDMSSAAMNVLPFLRVGKAVTAAKELTHTGVLGSALKAGLEGAKFGGTYGFANSLGENYDKPIQEQLFNSAKNAAVGAAVGGAFGSTVGGATSLFGQWATKKPSEIQMGIAKLRPEEPQIAKIILTKQYIRDKAGRFSPNQFKETPQEVKFVRDNQLKPLTAAEKRALDIQYGWLSESQPGLSIKRLSKEEGQAFRKLNGEVNNRTGMNIPNQSGKMSEISQLQQKLSQKQSGQLPLEKTGQISSGALDNTSLPPVPNQPEQQLAQQIAGQTKGLSSSKPIISQKGKLNVNNLNIDGSAKDLIQQQEAKVKPTVIGNKEVVKQAELATGSKSPMTDEQMKNIIANQLKNRQVVVDLSKKYNDMKASGASEQELAQVMVQIADQSKVARQGGTFAGRLLQAQNIMADESASPMQKVLALLDNANVPQEKYLQDSVKVDWNNPNSVVNFYRKYVPPSFGDTLTEIRYTNMLSSPSTHITNIASNALQTGIVAPIEKTISGVLDFGKTTLTGGERKYYTSAGFDYTKGMIKSVPDAFKNAFKVLKGNGETTNLDLKHMPLGDQGFKGKVLKIYSAPLRALEASDQFFKTLVRGGVTEELGKFKSLTTEDIARKAESEASYRLFRQAFGSEDQGVVLRTWDKWNSAVNNLRKIPGGNWIIPFLQTPTNILKQGVEYSPAGFSTIWGAKDKTAQVSKALLGSAVFAGAYQLAKSGLVSWDAPTNKSERDIYYSAGLQPYSIKIGDKWVSFSKLGPLSYPFAMAAALANAEKFNPDQGVVDNISQAMGGILKFFGDQSYVQNIGDVVDVIQQGGGNLLKRSLAQQAGNYAGQLIPYKSFLSWVTRIVDPVYRQGNTMSEKLMRDIPGLSQNAPAYTDLNGNPSMRDFPLLNAFSPYKVSQEKQPYTEMFGKMQDAKIETNREKQAADKIEQSKSGNTTVGDKLIFWDDAERKVETISISEQKQKETDAMYSLLSDQLKDSGDYQTWIDITEKHLSDLESRLPKLNTPDKTDEKISMQKKIYDLKQSLEKYKGYGGFKEGKAPAKITLKRVQMPTPKITLRKSTPKMLTIKQLPKYKAKTSGSSRRYTIK